LGAGDTCPARGYGFSKSAGLLVGESPVQLIIRAYNTAETEEQGVMRPVEIAGH